MQARRANVQDEWALDIDGFEVHAVRKRVKRMRMRVAPDGHVEVNVPPLYGLADVEEFVCAKRTWIARQQRTMQNSPLATAETATKEEQQIWRETVAAFVPLLVEKWEPVLGVRAGKLAYRNMKSRWGSCQPQTGRICINTRLALYPPECLEYVVVHELCHLREPGHTPRFWALVEGCLPNYRAAKKLLRS